MCACKCRYPRKPPEGARAPRGVLQALLNLDSLQGHQTLLTTEPSLQTLREVFKSCTLHTLISN